MCVYGETGQRQESRASGLIVVTGNLLFFFFPILIIFLLFFFYNKNVLHLFASFAASGGDRIGGWVTEWGKLVDGENLTIKK